jgi:hypothetical protein
MMQLHVHLYQRLLHVLEAVFGKTLEPLRVADIGLASSHLLRIPRVDRHHLEPALLQDLEDRAPSYCTVRLRMV